MKGYLDHNLCDIHPEPEKRVIIKKEKKIKIATYINHLRKGRKNLKRGNKSPDHHFGHGPTAFLLENPNQNQHE